MIALVPHEAFPLVFGNELFFYDTKNRATPGWYQITRNHDLRWWERIYTNKTLGGRSAVEQPTGISMPSSSSLQGGVFILEGQALRRIAEEKRIRELWDVPVEGIVFVAEPGIGIRQSLDLAFECR